MTGADAATNDASASGTSNEGARTYTVSGLGSDPVNIALFPCSSVDVDDDGDATFTATGTSPNQVASGVGTTTTNNAVIEVVQGVSTGGRHIGDDENPITPSNGAITFTVDSTSFDCAVPVVYRDADNDSQLDVDADGNAEENFGVGGSTTWIPAEAANAYDLDNDTVQFVNKDENFFVADNMRFNYDEGDVYRYDDDGDNDDVGVVTNGVAITFAQWETALSVNDVVDAAPYSRTFQNTFGIDNDLPGTPTGLAATVGDFDNDGDTNSDDARLSWNAPNPPNGLIAQYIVRVYDDVTTTAACDGTQVGTDVTTTSTTVDVEELGENNYCATVTAESQTGNEGSASSPVFFEVDTVADDEDAPTITDARVTDNGPLLTVYDTGDVIQLTFSEQMADGDVGTWVFIVTDTDGDRYQISCAGDNTCVLDSGANATVDDDVLTITAGAAPATDLNTGTGDDVAGLPATIVLTSTNVDDLGGNQVDLANSADVVIDTEGALVADTTAPTAETATFADAAGVAADFDGAGDTITVDYSETMGALGAGDTVTVGGNSLECTVDVTCTLATGESTNDSVVLTWFNATGDVVGAAATTVTASTGVTDVAGNAATGYPVDVN